MSKVLEPTQEEPTVKGALGRIGLNHATGATVVIFAQATTNASPEQVWAVWSELEKWPSWGKPLIQSARWVEKRNWEVGAKFEQKVAMGFPLGGASTPVVNEVNKGQSVSWWKISFGMKSCHIWFFEPLNDGGTNITKTQVVVGPMIFLGRMFGAKKRWNKLFQGAVEGLARAVERAGAKPAGTT